MKVRLDLPYFWLKACLILHLLFFPSNMRNLCKMRLNGNAMPDIQYIHNNVRYHYHCFCYFKVFIRYACFPKSLPPTTLLVNVSFLWPPLPEHPAWWGPVSTLPDDSSLTPWFPRVLGIPGFVLSFSHVLSLCTSRSILEDIICKKKLPGTQSETPFPGERAITPHNPQHQQWTLDSLTAPSLPS